MTAREPFKPISIDKKFGEIYFDQKCQLNGFEPAPKMNPFSNNAAEAVLKKYQNPKKTTKIKLVALADTLKFEKGSKLGKKLPYSKVKYSEVKFHKVFNQSKKTLVLGVQGPDKLNQYLVIGFEQPIKASNLDDRLAYADLAPRNNLKSRIYIPDVTPTRDPTPVYANLATPPPATETSRPMLPDSPTGKNGRTHEITEIQDTGLPRYEMSENSMDLNSAKMPGKSIQSPTLSISQKPMTPQSNTHTSICLDPNHSHFETIRDSANQQVDAIALCSKCRSKCEDLVSTATSPPVWHKKGYVAGLTSTFSSISSSSSSSSKSNSKTLNNISRSNTISGSRRSKDKPYYKRSNSMTSTSSRYSVTTDANSHYVINEERELYDHQPRSFVQTNVIEENSNPLNTNTVIVRDTSPKYISKLRATSHSGSRQARHRKKKSKREYRARSTIGTPIQQRTVTTTAAGNRNNDGEPLIKLATGRFRPFSEFSHEHDLEQHGICSICGEEGVGDPRQVEIIRTDISKGPMFSEDGCIYMYSATRPVEYANGRRSSRRGHRSVSSSRSEIPVQEDQITPVYVTKKESHLYTNEMKKYHRSPHESSVSSRTRSEPRILMGTVPYYHNTSPIDPRVAEVIVPIEMSRQQNKNKPRSHSRSRHNSMSGGEIILRPVGSVTYHETPLTHGRNLDYNVASHRSSGKKKIYRIESSDSDSSSGSDKSDPRCTGGIKVKPLYY